MPEWTAIKTTWPMSVSTSTHLLLGVSFYTPAGWRTFLQAYALPPPHTHYHRFTPTSTPLDPSHRGIIPGISAHDTVLLHDAILDPVTQDALIAIRVDAFEPSRPYTPLAKHDILRLSTANTSQVGTVTFRLLGSLGHSPAPFLHPSFNGTGRVFCTHQVGPYGKFVAALEYDLHANVGDDDEAHEAKVTEYLSILRSPTTRRLLDYDPYSGRICLQASQGKHSTIEILELAVWVDTRPIYRDRGYIIRRNLQY